METIGPLISVLSLLAIALMIYFAPSWVARSRGHNNASSIFVVNLFLGWTLLGWVGALAWAFSKDVAKP